MVLQQKAFGNHGDSRSLTKVDLQMVYISSVELLQPAKTEIVNHGKDICIQQRSCITRKEPTTVRQLCTELLKLINF